MSEPENIIWEHLRAMRAKLDAVEQRSITIADVGRKLDGLTHVVISGLGSLVRSSESLDKRVSRLEPERV